MAQALTLFDSRHLLIITSYDSWCAQMNSDLGLQLSRHGAPNMSYYVPDGNCTAGRAFLMVAVGLSGVYSRPDLVWFQAAGASVSNALQLQAASTVLLQELSLVWTSVATGAVVTAAYPGTGSGIWLPVNRSSTRLEVAPHRTSPSHVTVVITITRHALLQVWDLASDLNSTRSMRWRHGSCIQKVRPSPSPLPPPLMCCVTRVRCRAGCCCQWARARPASRRSCAGSLLLGR